MSQPPGHHGAAARWEHFSHGADVGIRGFGACVEEAFEQAALAMTAVITGPGGVRTERRVRLECRAPDLELLLVDWLNALVFEMADRNMLFGKYSVTIRDQRLIAEAWGEPVDRRRHQPAVEIKGATFTELQVGRQAGSAGWFAQAILDV